MKNKINLEAIFIITFAGVILLMKIMVLVFGN
jgi:hypothetical protein